MGLIDFMKNAGEALFGSDEAKTAQADAAQPMTMDDVRAKVLRDAIDKHGFEVDNLAIDVSGTSARVSGKVATQELREKVVLVVGNTAGIAQVDDRLEVEQAEPEARLYTVRSGDSLSKIAKEAYGDAMKYPLIFEANRPMLSDPDKIYPGQVLRIPPRD